MRKLHSPSYHYCPLSIISDITIRHLSVFAECPQWRKSGIAAYYHRHLYPYRHGFLQNPLERLRTGNHEQRGRSDNSHHHLTDYRAH